MHFAPMGAILADRLTREHLDSALPDAPVVRQREARLRDRTRAALASRLHRIAAALEPTAQPVPRRRFARLNDAAPDTTPTAS